MYGIRTPLFDSDDYTNFVIHSKQQIKSSVSYNATFRKRQLIFIYDTQYFNRRADFVGSSTIITTADKKPFNVLIASPIRSKRYLRAKEIEKQNNPDKKLPFEDESFAIDSTKKYGIEIKNAKQILFSTRFRNVKLIDMIPFPYHFLGLRYKYEDITITYKNAKKIAICLHLIDGREFDDNYQPEDFYTFSVMGNEIKGIFRYQSRPENQRKPFLYDVTSNFQMLKQLSNNPMPATVMLVIDISDTGV